MPSSYRWLLIIATVVSFQVGFSALDEVSDATHPEEAKGLSTETRLISMDLPAETQRAIWLAARSGYQSALATMKPWRATSSVALAIAAGLVFFLSMRMRMSSRNKARTSLWLSRAAVGAAILRTIDGSQTLIIHRSISDAMAKALLDAAVPQAEALQAVISAASTVPTVIWSILMVGAFVTLSTYFRSEHVRQALVSLEARDPDQS